jgi:hypothetical protein
MDPRSQLMLLIPSWMRHFRRSPQITQAIPPEKEKDGEPMEGPRRPTEG